MQTSDSEESRVLREGDVRREDDEGFPSQPLYAYLKDWHDRHGKAAKDFPGPKGT